MYNDSNQINSYASTYNQQYKSKEQDINVKINNIQNKGYFTNYSYDTLFEAFPVNTRITSRDENDKSKILSGKTVINGGSLDSAEFIHNQYKNSHNISENNNAYNKIDSNSFILDQFKNNFNNLEKNYSNTIQNQYIIQNNISSNNNNKIDRKGSNNMRLQELNALSTNSALPINKSTILDNKHSYPINTRNI